MEADIKAQIAAIYAQGDIEIEWESPTFFNNTFANVGNGGTRPESDLNTILSSGDAAGAGSPDNLVIDMYFVDVVPGFAQTAETEASGFGLFDDGGLAVRIGTAVLGDAQGRTLLARGLAQEVGRNLGLEHINNNSNLMDVGLTGSNLLPSQISTVIESDLTQPVPN